MATHRETLSTLFDATRVLRFRVSKETASIRTLHVPVGRECALALTKLEEAELWLRAAVLRVTPSDGE